MKNSKLFCSVMLCYSVLIVGTEPQEATLEGTLKQQTIRETFLAFLLKQELGRLSSVSHAAHEAVEPAIITGMEKAAIWESHVLNARNLNLGAQRWKWNDNDQGFKNFIIQCIKEFAQANPGTWIKLDLTFNSLGHDFAFLCDLLQAIVTTVHSLKIDLASLNLGENSLKSLPEQFFEGLGNLKEIYLYSNQLASLPERLFKGLDNLQKLDCSQNPWVRLPEHLFEGLNNLQELNLRYNELMNLPEHLFEGLHHLQKLILSYNRLSSLPEHLLKDLDNLQELLLFENKLECLPECIFESLNNLQILDLRNNELTDLSDRLFWGLNKLVWLGLSGNLLTALPKSLEGLNNLKTLSLGSNRLNEESISLLKVLRNKGVNVSLFN